jgi:hypothetical protein
MLLEGVTINDGRDGFSSAWIGVNSSATNMPRKPTEVPVAMIVARKGDISLKSDTQLV